MFFLAHDVTTVHALPGIWIYSLVLTFHGWIMTIYGSCVHALV